MEPNLLPLALFAFLSYVSLAFAGFGGIIIPITFGAHLYSIDWMLSVLIPVTVISNLYILIRHGTFLDRRVLFLKILPLMGIGLLIGVFLYQFIDEHLFRRLFGALVVVLAAREIVLLIWRKPDQTSASRLKTVLYLLAAGVIHGMYASGGPLLVYIVNKLELPKSVFRSTLSAVWLILNCVLVVTYFLYDKLDRMTLTGSAMMLPSLILGLMVGEFLHSRVSDRSFKLVIFSLLILTGFSIVYR